MRKKVLALVLALVMVVAMLPTVAFAASGYQVSGQLLVSGSTLAKAIKGSEWSEETKTLMLKNHATLGTLSTGSSKYYDTFAIYNSEVTIDLNGFTLTVGNDNTTSSSSGSDASVPGLWAVSYQDSVGKLTIKDSSNDKTGKIVSVKNGKQPLQVQMGGELTIEGGTIEASAAGVVVMNGKLNVTGGTIAGPYGVYTKGSQAGNVTVNISGGEVKGSTMNSYGLYMIGKGDKAEITGGTISGNSTGKTVEEEFTAAAAVYVNGEGSSVTVSDEGKVNYTGARGYGIMVNNGSAKIEEGATITVTNEGVTGLGGTPEEVNEKIITGVCASGEGASIDISGGTISGGEAGASAYGKGTVKISGNANISGRYGATAYSGGQVTIEGGTIYGTAAGLGTNGSDPNKDTTSITVKGGKISGDIVGAYLPAGKLTVNGETTSIEGKAGIVVRGGTLDVQGGNITATGTGEVEIGDAGTKVQPAGIAVDKNENYNSGKNEVTVSGENTTVKSAEGQPTVSYSEKGSTENVKPDGDENKIEVKGGKFESGTDPDYTVTNYISKDNGVNSDGTVETANKVQLAIVDFGYLADAPEGMSKDKTVWTSPKGIDYTVWNSDSDKWGDATFYWAFNRALTEDEASAGVEVTFTCGDQKFTDTCKAQGIRFASSLKNSTQLGDDVTENGGLTGGDYTISSADNKFTVPEELETVHVTLPAADTEDAPEITKAPTANLEGKPEDADKYTVEYTSVDTENDVYSVKIDATKVTEHQNENGVYGYWTGMAVKLDEGHEGTINGYYAKIGNGDWQYSGLDKIDGKGNYACIYFKDLGEYEVQLVWTTDTVETAETIEGLDASGDKLTFSVTVDITYGTSEKPLPVYPPVSGGTATPSATVTTPTATNGSYTVSDRNAKAGDTVTITPKADEGYTVDTVVVTDKDGKDVTVTDNGDGTYTFTMPEKASQPVTVKVTFRKVAPSEKFTDVAQDAWYAEAINYVVEKGLMDGTGETTFAPNDPTNRAMLVTILYRLEGKPAVTKDIPFSDVASGEWYSDAINWAAANEIVDGYGDDTFRPTRELTREEAATILYRYAAYKKYDMTTTDDLTGYTDAETVSTWADTAMSWAVGTELINGMTTTTLVPSGGAIRAQIAAILMRFCENVAK